MPLGTAIAYAFPFLAVLALAVLFWADCLEERDRKRARTIRHFARLN